MKKVLFLFPSIHFVLKAEKRLKEEGLPCEIIPVPKEIRSDCGMALLIPSAELPQVWKILKGVNLCPEEVYEKVERTYRRVGYGKDGYYQ